LLFVFKEGRENPYQTSDFIKRLPKIAKNAVLLRKNAKINWVQPEPSSFYGENVGNEF
jgi:hypothetical protein